MTEIYRGYCLRFAVSIKAGRPGGLDIAIMRQQQNIYVCVRRGGPNQESGLAHLRSFLEENDIAHDVNDPSLSLGKVGELVKKHL